MSLDKTTRQNRVREALDRIYDQQPAYFREYLRKYRDDPTSRVFAPLAEAYRRMGKVEEAIHICKEGLEHHPDFHAGRVTLAKCYIDRRKYAEAKTELERVIQYVPDNLLAHRLLGESYAALGDKTWSLHYFKMALLLSPNDVVLAEKVHLMEREADSATVEKDALAEHEMDLASDADLSWIEDKQETLDRMMLQTQDLKSPTPQKEIVLSGLNEGSDVDTVLAADSGKSTIDELLGFGENDVDDEAFKVEHVSSIFVEKTPKGKREITTETLGDLYLSQGQCERALKIFEKLALHHASADLQRKMNACRIVLGVDKETLVRNRKIEVLRKILKKVKETPS